MHIFQKFVMEKNRLAHCSVKELLRSYIALESEFWVSILG